ncbi:hypothetical protein [Thermomonospora cellulosilytica]|uniref:Uncharacterized protein n=1 Tax=Thermomonospora cellulosilytica TaxID=1411118 RepID=A0A7W3N4C9_9ACTN|nr:hypothetical protein [Thermomonospora cellulosilytica]MBA9007331.1 hypothetical protein [Thermomonospora cellulosilytica]
MNQASRGLIFALFLLAAIALGFFAAINIPVEEGENPTESIAAAIVLGLGSISASIIAAGAMAGMPTLPGTQQRVILPPGAAPQHQPQQPMYYPQPGMAPQPQPGHQQPGQPT